MLVDAIIAFESNIYIGTIASVKEKFITLRAVELKTNEKLDLKCYKNELSFMKPLKMVNVSTEDQTCDFTLQELCIRSKILRNYFFIQRFDRLYHDAIAEIQSESFVGFYMPGISNGRFSDSSIMAISTSKSIYLFDIKILGRVENELKNILEANVPKKIIHDCSRAGDHLMHKQNIKLNGVFDTMIAHCALGFDKKRSSLDECLHDHFQLPDKFLDQGTEQWHRRPLSSNDKNIAAQNVVFLQKLHFKLTRIMESSMELKTS